MIFRIDPEFKDYLGALDGESKQALEESLMAEGCRDALVVWPQADGTPILLDGHNRFAICEELSIPYRVIECPAPIADREDAVAWIVQNQRARRNMTQGQLDYLCGKIFNTDKREHGGTGANRFTIVQRCQNGTSVQTEKTAEKVAREFGLSARTVHRHGKFAKAVDSITDEHGPQAKIEILAGRKKIADYMPPPEPVASTEPAVREDAPVPAPAKKASAELQHRTAPAAPAAEAGVATKTETASGTDTLAGMRDATDSECVDWMAENLQPTGNSGAVAKPIPMPEGASENLADPEVAARGDNPFIFALCQMETQATRAELGLKLHPPAPDLRPALKKRLADLSAALQKIALSLEELP